MNIFNHTIDVSSSIQPSHSYGFRFRSVLAIAAAIGLAASVAHAGAVFVPNGDFSAPGNAGSVGGGLVGNSGTNVGIGSGLGPWTGSFQGGLGLLVPPVLTINSTTQTATISGVVGLNIGGVITNGGYFSQTLSVPYVPNKRYTVTTDIDAGVLLGLNVLTASNAGIALRSGASVLSASTTAPPQLVNLASLVGTTYRLSLIYDTGATVSGNVDIQLFDQPQGLLTANLLSSAIFSNVMLNVGAITDSSTQLHVSGLGSQGTEVGTPFAAPLVAEVTDAVGNPLEGVFVNVSAPTTGASAVLTSGASSGTTVQALTDNNGLVSVTATANSIAGCYRVTASVDGVNSTALFYLRNWSTAQMQRFLDAGVNGASLQDSIFCDGFE